MEKGGREKEIGGGKPPQAIILFQGQGDEMDLSIINQLCYGEAASCMKNRKIRGETANGEAGSIHGKYERRKGLKRRAE